ncbi:MAG: FAD-dependent oxidoreductase [Thermomicrobiales bacterium]|nr:FAD-dependent oxidoreductase [Thermomicrobiales bacterium]
MKLTLASKSHLTDNIWAFIFTPEEELHYKAGQYIRVQLPHDQPDDEGIKRFFTNSAPPFEGVVQITTRITDSTFKQALSKLDIGDDALEMIKPPEGDFLWRESDRPLTLVAAGIGVTPYYSILAERVHDDQPIPATLLYNGRTDALPWKDEFAALTKSNPEFSVDYQIGTHITLELLQEKYPDLNESIIYLSGPEALVDSLGEQLKSAGLPEAQLMQDWFPHYDDTSY